MNLTAKKKKEVKKNYNYSFIKCCATCKYSHAYSGVTVCKYPHYDDSNDIEEFPIIPLGVCDKWEEGNDVQ